MSCATMCQHVFFSSSCRNIQLAALHDTGQLSLSFLVQWLPISRLNLAVAPLLHDPHQPKSCLWSITDKEPATCPHCSSQFVNQSVLEIHLQRCPTTEEDKNAGRGRGQGRGRSTGQVGQSFTSERFYFK